MTDIAVFN